MWAWGVAETTTGSETCRGVVATIIGSRVIFCACSINSAVSGRRDQDAEAELLGGEVSGVVIGELCVVYWC